MYQTLIWLCVLRDDPRGMGAALHAKDGKCLANTLIDRVREI